MVKVRDLFLGKLAIKNGLVSETQVRECLPLVGQREEWGTLGQVLLAHRYLDDAKLAGLERMRARTQAMLAESLFGRIAVQAGLITQSQLEECLTLQKDRKLRVPIGKLLLEKGYLAEEEWKAVLQEQDVQRLAKLRGEKPAGAAAAAVPAPNPEAKENPTEKKRPNIQPGAFKGGSIKPQKEGEG